MPPLYGLTPRRKDQLARLLDDGGSIRPRARSGAAARGSTWVLVTGDEPDEDGWWEGVVSIDAAGEWTDLTRTVLVSAADGSDLVADQRYLCTRTGDDEDGTARFRAPAQFEFEYTPPALLSGSAAVANHAVSADYAWEDTGTEITLPAAGTYLLWGRVLGMGWVNKDADPTAIVEIPTTNPSLHARLANGSTAVSGTTVTVYVVYLTRDRQYHSASFTATFTALAATTLKLQVFGVGPPTGYSWDNGHGLSTGAFEDGRVGYVRLTGVDLTPLPDPGDGEAGGTYP